MLQTLGTALLAAALAQAPTGKRGEASDDVMSHVYAGLTSVRPIYLGGSDCRPPAGFQVLQPHKLASGAWDTQDPVYRVTDGMVMRISDWTRLL